MPTWVDWSEGGAMRSGCGRSVLRLFGGLASPIPGSVLSAGFARRPADDGAGGGGGMRGIDRGAGGSGGGTERPLGGGTERPLAGAREERGAFERGGSGGGTERVLGGATRALGGDPDRQLSGAAFCTGSGGGPACGRGGMGAPPVMLRPYGSAGAVGRSSGAGRT